MTSSLIIILASLSQNCDTLPIRPRDSDTSVFSSSSPSSDSSAKKRKNEKNIINIYDDSISVPFSIFSITFPWSFSIFSIRLSWSRSRRTWRELPKRETPFSIKKGMVVSFLALFLSRYVSLIFQHRRYRDPSRLRSFRLLALLQDSFPSLCSSPRGKRSLELCFRFFLIEVTSSLFAFSIFFSCWRLRRRCFANRSTFSSNHRPREKKLESKKKHKLQRLVLCSCTSLFEPVSVEETREKSKQIPNDSPQERRSKLVDADDVRREKFLVTV